MSFEVERVETAAHKRGSGAGPLMRAHTVTLYNALGEVDRHATYARTVLAGVRVQESSGAVASLSGKVSTDGVLVFIPGDTAGFVEPEAYTGEGWTLREDDLLVIGECDSDVPPATVQQLEATREVYRLTGYRTCTGAARGSVHHWEVAGA